MEILDTKEKEDILLYPHIYLPFQTCRQRIDFALVPATTHHWVLTFFLRDSSEGGPRSI